MNILRMKKYIENLYDVSDIKTGFDFWYFKLFNILLDMFEYKNMPSGLNKREIELNLMMTGHACIIAKNDGTLFTPLTNLYGYDEYYQPTYAVFANPVVRMTKRFTLDQDCIVIYNNSLKDSFYYIKTDSGLDTFVKRYARQLADIESTANIYAVNSRLTSIPVSNDENVIQSIKLFFDKLAIGKRSIVADNNIVEKFRCVDINRTEIKDGINDWLIARDKILEQFYRDLGVNMYQPKKAQVTDDEVDANDQMLLISTDDMLKSRKEGLEKVNNMFGTDIQVRLNPKFDVKEVKEDVRTQARPLPGTEQ